MQNGIEACPQKSVKERMVEKAFVRALNKVIGGKDEFIEKLLVNIEKGLSAKEYDFSMDEIDEKLSELQKELMTLVRLNARTGLDAAVYSNEYAKVSAEIELFRDRRQKLKEQSALDSLRIERIKELKAFLKDSDSVLERFDGNLFGRLIERVTVHSLVEVTFVFKTGVEVKEIVG